MAERNDEMMRTRIDASSSRLTSLRTATADATAAAARRPKFVPKAARRRSTADGEGGEEGAPAASSERPQPGQHKPAHRAGDLTRDRGRGGRGSADGRGRGRGRGRGANLPQGRVTFVGTLSGGSSFSSGGSTAPRASAPAKPVAAADGVGISVLDDEDGTLQDEFNGMEIEEQWPPTMKSVMEPMTLSFARRPEPSNSGAIFCDESGQIVLPNDTLLYLQLPTTLPLASATRVGTPADEAKEPETKPVNKFAVASEAVDAPVKKEEELTEEVSIDRSEDQIYDKSIATAPGGFVGKLVIHRSGKTVLMLGDKKFDVAAAHTPAFTEEVYSIDSTEQQLCMLGSVDRHLVVTPDFDALLG
ncbi:hypothetical protein Poli38472_003412 [Pythium oligandrum]|uniref:RNA polymerase III RPC4 n=1 Tax=Pythium oligandrum TaxID=41045 RepID=A0A8K1C6K7_PYTOL|nr:hypothetical protein Poli38472_003412 [Pythium oligandrum]|eukprot:TMW57487.1 hypothetical protein Poli38472_003412 [Pythium oligandrum]